MPEYIPNYFMGQEQASSCGAGANGVALLLLTRLDTHSYGFHTRVLYVGQSTQRVELPAQGDRVAWPSVCSTLLLSELTLRQRRANHVAPDSLIL